MVVSSTIIFAPDNTMKNQILTLAALVIFSFDASASKSSTTAAGTLNTASNWSSTPTSADTLIVDKAMTWGSSFSWASNTPRVMIIKSGGSIGPTGNNNTITFHSTMKIFVETGGQINNPSGNNSNHAIIFGTTDIWGKRACAGNVVINGPVEFNISNPCGYVVLPVTLVSLKSATVQNTVTLNWVTADEENIASYQIEKTTNGAVFASVGRVSAVNSKETVNQYSFTDKNANGSARSFYRIKAIHTDGAETVMGSTQVKLNLVSGITVKENNLSVTFEGLTDAFDIEIFDLQGKKIISNSVTNSEVTNISTLAKGGIYIVVATSYGTHLSTNKFIY